MTIVDTDVHSHVVPNRTRNTSSKIPSRSRLEKHCIGTRRQSTDVFSVVSIYFRFNWQSNVIQVLSIRAENCGKCAKDTLILQNQ